jgi:flagellar biosynthetic protein FliS
VIRDYKRSKAIEAYKVSKEVAISETTDPRILVKMLFDKACALMSASVKQLEDSERESFEKTSLHALQIILSLRFVLKTSEEDELSKSLSETYTSIAASLFRAKEKKDKISLLKIEEALRELRDAWGHILEKS